jgi:hypothetical protein
MNKLIGALLIVVIAALIIVSIAFASQTQDLQPVYRLMDGEKELGVVYRLDSGLLIITDNGTLYTCGCEEDIPCNLPLITPTPTHGNGEDTPTPVITPTEPVPSETPEPTEKPKCNRGLGNNEEGCDPGNSGGKPGAAGEDNEPKGPPGKNK